MAYTNEYLKPSASDFGSFVYCGAKLFLDKSPALDSFRKAKPASYGVSKKTMSLLRGQQNEHKCIEWLLKNHNEPLSIVFDGTGKENHQTFPAIIKTETVYETIQCKPDLILKRADRIILYEFKAVRDTQYLLFSEYDSVHAQVWCYRFIDSFKVDNYYLFRYFEDPFMWGVYPKVKELTDNDLSDEKFIPLFEKYLSLIRILNNANKKEFDFEKLNRPVNQPDKCHHCIYYNLYCSPECEVKE